MADFMTEMKRSFGRMGIEVGEIKSKEGNTVHQFQEDAEVESVEPERVIDGVWDVSENEPVPEMVKTDAEELPVELAPNKPHDLGPVE